MSTVGAAVVAALSVSSRWAPTRGAPRSISIRGCAPSSLHAAAHSSIVKNNGLHCCFLLRCGRSPENIGRIQANVVLQCGIGLGITMRNNRILRTLRNLAQFGVGDRVAEDRKSTRLNSSHT